MEKKNISKLPDDNGGQKKNVSQFDSRNQVFRQVVGGVLKTRSASGKQEFLD